MSVLKAKIRSGSSRVSPSLNIGVWEQLQTVLIDILSPLTGIDLAAGPVERTSERLKLVRGGFQSPQAVFTLDYHLSDWPVLVVPDHRLCSHIAAQALHSKRGAEVFESKIRYLDLMLCEPISKAICKFLSQWMGRGPDGMSIHQSGQALGLDGFDLGSENANWLRLDLGFLPEELSAKELSLKELSPKELSEPPSGGPDTALPVAQDSKDESLEKKVKEGLMRISLVWPAELFKQLGLEQPGCASSRQDDKDRANPATTLWAMHMLQSVEGAAIRIRAVLDDYPMSVADCTRLEIGQILPLDGASTQSVRLEVDTETGPVALSNAVLGTYKTRRALKLNQALSDNAIVLDGAAEKRI